MRFLPKMNVWAHKDAIQDLQDRLNDDDVAQLRATCKDWRGVIDSTLSKLAPVNLDCPLLASRTLPGLKSLHLTHLHYLQPQQLLQCSALTQLTQLHTGGTACSRLRTHHLAWISRLTNLQDLSISKCGKVKLSILSCWHSLTKLKTLTLIGLSVYPTDANYLNPFLAAGAAQNLTALVLGDHQGLSFLSDRALEGLGGLLGPVGKIRVLDLSGCIELTDAGIRHLSGLTSLQQLSLHNCMKISTGATQTLATLTALKTLNLRGCSQLTDTQVLAMLKTLTRLQVLNLQACSGLTGSCLNPRVCKQLVELKTLNLSYCQGLRSGVFEGLAMLPQLKGLDLTGCQVMAGCEVLGMLGKLNHLTSLQASYWRCKGTAAVVAANPGGSSSSTGPAAALLPANLQHLNLSHLSCSEAFLGTLIPHFPKTLTHLDLTQCSGFGPASGSNCPEGLGQLHLLQTLKLSSGLGGMPSCMLGFMSGLTNLQDLQLEYVHGTAAVGGEWMPAAVNSSSSKAATWLQGLTGSNTDSIASDSSSAIAHSTIGVPLDESNIISCHNAAAAAAVVSKGARHHRPVTGVNQLLAGAAPSSSQCSSSSTDLLQTPVRRTLFGEQPHFCAVPSSSDTQTLQHPAQQQHWLRQLQHLQNLTVTFSPWMTDHILRDLSALSCLTSLSLIACQNLTGSGFQTWSSSSSSSSRSTAYQATDHKGSSNSYLDPTLRTGLVQLNLTGCGGLTDQGLAAVTAACPRLQELLLPGCRGIGDEGVSHLGKLSRLQVLKLASNKDVTARSINTLFPALLHLKSLSLSLCGNICDEALSPLAAAPALTAADLRGCWQITDAGVHQLLQSSRSLLQLNIDSCHRLSSRCCPDTFRPGGVPLPAPDSTDSSRPTLLIRVAMPSRQTTSKSSSRTAYDTEGVEASTHGLAQDVVLAAGAAAVLGETGSDILHSAGDAESFGMTALQQALQQSG